MHNLPSWTTNFICLLIYFDGLVQDCSISIANALEILQSCIKPSIWWNDVIPKLEIEQKINHKILQLTYKAQHGKAPAYLSSLLSRIRGQTSTHSSSQLLGVSWMFLTISASCAQPLSIEACILYLLTMPCPFSFAWAAWKYICSILHFNNTAWIFIEFLYILVIVNTLLVSSVALTTFHHGELLLFGISFMKILHSYYHYNLLPLL